MNTSDRLLLAAIREDMRLAHGPTHELHDIDIVMTIITIDAPAVALPSIFLRRQAG